MARVDAYFYCNSLSIKLDGSRNKSKYLLEAELGLNQTKNYRLENRLLNFSHRHMQSD
jgi:hypothetical protein